MSWLVCWNENCQFCSNANQILETLSQLFQNGLQYKPTNNYSSAISAFHDQIQEKPMRKHLRICLLGASHFGCLYFGGTSTWVFSCKFTAYFQNTFLTTEGLFLFFFNTSENIRVTKASKILINFSFWLQHVIASKYLNEQLGVFLNMKQQNWS